MHAVASPSQCLGRPCLDLRTGGPMAVREEDREREWEKERERERERESERERGREIPKYFSAVIMVSLSKRNPLRQLLPIDGS